MTNTNQQIPTNKTCILRWPDVQKRVGLCRSHAYNLIQKNEFPKPIKIAGARASGWISFEIDEWIENRIAASRNKD